MSILHAIQQMLFPPKCIFCGELLQKEETDLCRSCRAETFAHPKPKRSIPFLESWRTLWYYEGRVRESLLRYKFAGRRSYAPAYGRLLAMRLQEEYPEGFDLLTWVPISPLRRLRRGYDQVELLAQAVARELGAEATATLQKHRHNRPQSGITGHAQRRANVLGVYRAVDPALVRGRKILLLDDIVTTGSTISEAARVLLTAGASEIHGAALAAAPDKHRTR